MHVRLQIIGTIKIWNSEKAEYLNDIALETYTSMDKSTLAQYMTENNANWLRTIATQSTQTRNQSNSHTITTAIKQELKTCKASKGSRRY